MTLPEATERWGLGDSTIRGDLKRGRFASQIERGLVRKSGNTWLIHEQAMREVYGEPKK